MEAGGNNPMANNNLDFRAYFTITSQLPLKDITKHIGVDPDDRSWSNGDLRLPSQHSIYAFSRWSLSSGIQIGAPLDEHLKSLWSRMAPFRKQICNRPADMNAHIACTGTFQTKSETILLSAGHFSTAAYYKIVIDFDFYFEDSFDNDEVGKPYWKW